MIRTLVSRVSRVLRVLRDISLLTPPLSPCLKQRIRNSVTDAEYDRPFGEGGVEEEAEEEEEPQPVAEEEEEPQPQPPASSVAHKNTKNLEEALGELEKADQQSGVSRLCVCVCV